MRTEDALTKHYLSDAKRFAKVFNNEVFDGKPVIHANSLRELDGEELAEITKKNKGLKFLERYRDCVKMHDDNAVFVILGIEHQTHIDYSMPVRMLLYDALNYEDQRRMVMKGHERNKDLKGDEFLGKFSKNDKIIPVISLVIYWGTEGWDGATSLSEILDFSGDLSQYRDKIIDYKMNLLDVHNMENLEQYDGELKALLGFVKYQKDKGALQDFVKENQNVLQSVDTETAKAIQVLANIKEVEPLLANQKNKEAIDMCQALQDWKEELLIEGRAEGRLEGRTEGRLEGGIETLILDNQEENKTKDQIIAKLMKRFSLTEENATTYYNKFTS